jgi:predicted enzyme involved in methoxymalonyl-ACP biosynthesis
MSCRAFSRRVEHQTLALLLLRFPEAGTIELDFHATERNGPVQDFLSALLDLPKAGPVTISRDTVEQSDLPLHHKVTFDP